MRQGPTLHFPGSGYGSPHPTCSAGELRPASARLQEPKEAKGLVQKQGMEFPGREWLDYWRRNFRAFEGKGKSSWTRICSEHPPLSAFMLSHHLCLTAVPCTVAHEVPLSLEFSRQEFWSGLPFSPPVDLPDQGRNPHLLHWQVDSLPLNHLGAPFHCLGGS